MAPHASLVSADRGPALEGATAYNSQRKVALGPGGEVAVTYVDRVDGVSTVLAKISHNGGRTWQRLVPLSTGEAFRSSLAFDAAGDLHVTWTETASSGRQVFYAKLGPQGEWSDRRQLSDTPGYSGYPSLAVDSSDRLHVVWYGLEDATYQVFYRYHDPREGWSPTVRASSFVRDANAPAIAIGPDDRVHVAFFTFVEGAYDVRYMFGGPDGWSAVERVNPVHVASRQPSIAVHGDGTVAIAYAQGDGEDTAVVYTERRGSGWLPGVEVSPPSSGASAPSLAVLSNGVAMVAFETADGQALLAQRANDGTWQHLLTIARDGARWSSLSWAAFPAWSWAAAPAAVWTVGGPSDYALGFSDHAGERTAPVGWSLSRQAAALVIAAALLGAAAALTRRRLLADRRSTYNGA